ncbi:MAG: hypothetical protein MJK04_35605, partial [Psychrosphaera sp.]|nr:hypothetical protein [Psychrosphaera sp.]
SAIEDGRQQQIVSITDDDTASVSLSISAASIAEVGGASIVSATLSQTTFENVTVELGFTGTAIQNTDYVISTSSIVILAGDLVGMTVLTATQDTFVENNETIIIDIIGVNGGRTTENGAQQQTVNITDNNNPLAGWLPLLLNNQADKKDKGK